MGLSRRAACCAGLLLAAVLAAGAGLLALLLGRSRCDPPRYWRAAVAADTRRCSDVGRDILKRGGSAVDAAIAALVCTSVLNPQSMGLGGGVIFTIYNASTGKVEVLNARERAPQNITEGLLDRCGHFLLPGAQWIAVPGELRGYEEAHLRYGRLPWKELFEPTIEMLGLGIQVPDILSQFLKYLEFHSPLKNTSLCGLVCTDGGAVLRRGEVLSWSALEKTLKAVAENGAKEFYSGKTAEKLVQDVRAEGGTLTLEDLKNYHIELTKPLNMSLDKYTIYSAPRPAAGAVLFFILNVLKGFNFTKVDMEAPNRRAKAYHYIAETLKFANGQKAKLDDPNFSNIKEEVLHELISDAFADYIRQLIDDRGDHPATHYDPTQLRSAPFGTSHVAVLAEDGSAVSATSTINHPFGSMVYSQQTGIILNNELADFCMKRSSKDIFPGEMPPSSMTPSILLSKGGQSKLIIGGSGGPLIIPAVAQAIINKLWLGYDLDRAISAPILYATGGGSIQVEKPFPPDLQKALADMGHRVSPMQQSLNVVQGISQDGSCIFPYSDPRKQGEASGY
ncbi:glutathione hydrolase 5 proenzyme isoform X1 [Candoia aspera]|uniref:glutathione hydrolase 5 proenzyme isoform X1 n=1 Tax=Candoia aspera TaxID=51853 RepID=UPI002FD86914